MKTFEIYYASLVKATVEAETIEEAEEKFDNGECIEEVTLEDTSRRPLIREVKE